MGPKTPYDTERLPPGIITLITTIFGFIFLVGLLELSVRYPSVDSSVLGATTKNIAALEILFIALIITLTLTTVCCIRLFKSRKK